MKNIFHMKSIKSHIIWYFSGIFILTTGLLGYIGYNYFSKILINEILNYSNRIVDGTKINIDTYFKQVKTLLQITASNETVITGLKHRSDSDYQKILTYDRAIENLLMDVKKFNSDIKDIIILNSDGNAIYTSGHSLKAGYGFFEQGWFPKKIDKYSKVLFVGTHEQNYYIQEDENDGNVISAVIPVIDYMSMDRKILGVILCNLWVNRIQEINKATVLEKTGMLLVMDNSKNFINKPDHFNLDKNALSTLVENTENNLTIKNLDKERVLVFTTSEITQWKIIALIPMDEILAHLNSIRFFAIILIAACIILVNSVSVLLSVKITKPIVRLMKKMKGIEQGDFDIKLYDDSCEEIEMLSKRIDLMVERINRLNKDIYSFEIASKDANLKALQAQINPHFFFNTLQCIKLMAVNEKTKEISKMVTMLGNMLRYAIYDAQGLVEISSEIAHVMEYLHIQDYRYPGKIAYTINCDEELSKFKTLKLILQPIVENAVNHGLKDRNEGVIGVDIVRLENDIQISVHDNGIGMTDDEAKIILESLDSPEQNRSSSIGLKNVHDRIRLKFGQPYGIKINRNIESGCCIEILIPAINGTKG